MRPPEVARLRRVAELVSDGRARPSGVAPPHGLPYQRDHREHRRGRRRRAGLPETAVTDPIAPRMPPTARSPGPARQQGPDLVVAGLAEGHVPLANAAEPAGRVWAYDVVRHLSQAGHRVGSPYRGSHDDPPGAGAARRLHGRGHGGADSDAVVD